VPRINLSGVSKHYGGNAPNAVADLDLEIGDGEFMCLLGPSGCGKTTTLRMIAGLEHLTDGEIQVGSRVVDSVRAGIFVPPEKREMGLVFQSYALWPHLTIEQNTDFGLRLRQIPRAEREERVSRVMKTLGIEQYRDRYPSQLSGGQQQRVALARMLAVNPGVLLLDEPLSNLDAALRLEMRAELKRLHREFGTTIVFVTHDQWEAMTLATTIAVMSAGMVQQVGTPADIYDRPASQFVAQFVGNPPINILRLDGAKKSALSGQTADYFATAYPNLREIGSVGIRPETLRIARGADEIPAGAFSGVAEVTGILPTGGNWIIELTCSGEKLFLTTQQAPDIDVGDRCFFWVEARALHVFDKGERRLADADAALRPGRMH
jgi:iron(III) transport system ATP-binding protein